MGINQERCPKCFSRFGIWTSDPIITQDGAKYKFDETSGLLIPETIIEKRRYKGFLQIKALIVQEIQDIRKAQEIDIGIPEAERTTFSKVKSDEQGFWIINKKQLKELRESTEKILETIGQSKEDYFNYDEEGTERQSLHKLDWIDLGLTTKGWIGQIKDTHIEELRHFISTAIPMYKFNIGRTVDSSYNSDHIINLFYDDTAHSEVFFQDQFHIGSQIIQSEKGYGALESPYITYRPASYFPIYFHEPTQQWRIYEFPNNMPVLYYNADLSRFHWRAYKTADYYSNHTQKLLMIPRTPTQTILHYTVRELACIPIPVDETFGYPCVKYGADINFYPMPKEKSAPFLEDNLENYANFYSMTKLENEQGYIFKDENLIVTNTAQGTEEHLEARYMENNSWGLSDPPAQMIIDCGDGYFRSVSRYGTIPLGTYSLFIPAGLKLVTLPDIKETLETIWIFDHFDIKYNMDISTIIMKENIFDPIFNDYRDLVFGNNCLLTKIDGAVLAQGKYIINHILLSAENSINLNSNTIARITICKVDGTEWTQITNFDESTADDTHYRIESNILYFGDNINGILPSGSEIEITNYTDELVLSKYYASGYLVLNDKDYNLEDTQCYVILNYYNIPSQFQILQSEVTNYEVTYLTKPSTLNEGLYYQFHTSPPYYPPNLDPQHGIELHTVADPLPASEFLP